MSRLDEIQARLADATPGPWVPGYDAGWTVEVPEGAEIAAMTDQEAGQGRADADFIAHAREDMPALIEFARRVEAVLDDHESTNEQVFDELDRAMKRLNGGAS